MGVSKSCGAIMPLAAWFSTPLALRKGSGGLPPCTLLHWSPLLTTGILAVLVGLIGTIWAAGFIGRRSGPWVMFLLSIALFLVGGGFGPPFNGTVASLVATRIGKPLTWWRMRLPSGSRNLLRRLWPGILIFCVLMFLFAVETTVFGVPLSLLFGESTTYLIILRAGNVILVFMLLSLLSAFAYDIQVDATRMEKAQPDHLQA